MARIYDDITRTVGNTPLIRVDCLMDSTKADVLAKLEFFNPLSSVKDRIGVSMINAAERDGRIKRIPLSSNLPRATPVSPWPLSAPPGTTVSFSPCPKV